MLHAEKQYKKSLCGIFSKPYNLTKTMYLFSEHVEREREKNLKQSLCFCEHLNLLQNPQCN